MNKIQKAEKILSNLKIGQQTTEEQTTRFSEYMEGILVAERLSSFRWWKFWRIVEYLKLRKWQRKRSIWRRGIKRTKNEDKLGNTRRGGN